MTDAVVELPLDPAFEEQRGCTTDPGLDWDLGENPQGPSIDATAPAQPGPPQRASPPLASVLPPPNAAPQSTVRFIFSLHVKITHHKPLSQIKFHNAGGPGFAFSSPAAARQFLQGELQPQHAHYAYIRRSSSQPLIPDCLVLVVNGRPSCCSKFGGQILT
jgi:hypothetical protein